MQLPAPLNGNNELDCRHSIFIFTSNLSLESTVKRVGFAAGPEKPSTVLISEEDRCKEALVNHGINPEIAGRIEWFLHYEPLTEPDIKKVIRLEVKRCARAFGLSVNKIDEAIIEGIIQATGSKFGMRAYKQLIKRKLGKTFAKRKSNSTTIAIRGNLNAIEVVSCSEHSRDIQLNKEV